MDRNDDDKSAVVGGERSEVRQYVLNAEKAVKNKLKTRFHSLQKKSKGQCLVANLDLTTFQAVYSALIDFYKGQVNYVYDKNNSLVECKIGVKHGRRKVQITLYNTTNKVMLQGSKCAVDWWHSSQLNTVFDSIPDDTESRVSASLTTLVCTSTGSALPLRPLSPTDPVSVNRNLPPVADVTVSATTDLSSSASMDPVSSNRDATTVADSVSTSRDSCSSGSLSHARPRSSMDSVSEILDVKSVLVRLDKLEESMADLFGVMAADKLNLVREATRKEIELITTKHRTAVDCLRGEMKVKDSELSRVRGEMKMLDSEVRRLRGVMKIKDDELSRLKGETAELKKALKRKEEGAAEAAKIIDSLNGEVGKKNNDIDVIGSAKKGIGSGVGVGGVNRDECVCCEDAEERRESGDVSRWQLVTKARFKVPDVLLVGNSNVRDLDPRILKPLFLTKHVLDKKTLRGAANYLKDTDICPRGSVVVQAIDNEIGVLSPSEIIKTIGEIVDICKSRFPGVAVYVVEPLGRSVAEDPQKYWRTAARMCEMLYTVPGIQVVSIPANLKTADATLFVRERGGYIHLNRDGVGALSRAYTNHFVGGGRGGGGHVKGLRMARDGDRGGYRYAAVGAGTSYSADRADGVDHGRVGNMTKMVNCVGGAVGRSDGRDGGPREKGSSVAKGADGDGGRVRSRYMFDGASGVDHENGRNKTNVAKGGGVVVRGGDEGGANREDGNRFGLLVHTLIEGLSKFT